MNEGLSLIPNDYHGTLEQLIEVGQRYNLESILLTGSRVTGSADAESDIDLIVVMADEKDRSKIVSDILRVTKGDPIWDIKVASKNELKKMWQGTSHLQIHLMIEHAVQIVSNQFTGKYPLRMDLLVNKLSNDIRVLEDNLGLLEDGVKYTGCAISTINCIKTVFFIEKYVLKTSNSELHSFTRKVLGKSFAKANDLYESFSKANLKSMKFSTTITIPQSLDKRQKDEDYHHLFEAIRKLLERYRGIRKSLDKLC
jgi:predicted nucleotidyltransferase